MCTLDGICRTCRGALSYWDGRQRWTCRRCTGMRVPVPDPNRTVRETLVPRDQWPAVRDRIAAGRAA